MAEFSDEEIAHGLDPENVPDEAGAMAHSDVPVGGGEQEFALVVPSGPDKVAEVADALNQAAEGREHLVQWTGEGFRVPVDVAEAANFDGDVAKLQGDLSSSSPAGVADPATGLADARETAQAQHEASAATGTAVGTPTTAASTTASTTPDRAPDAGDGGNTEGGNTEGGNTDAEGWPVTEGGKPDFDAMKIHHMRNYAKANNIDLTGTTRKEEIRELIEK